MVTMSIESDIQIKLFNDIIVENSLSRYFKLFLSEIDETTFSRR